MAPATFWISGKRQVNSWLLMMALALAAGLASCDDRPTEPQEPEALALLPGLTVSDANGANAGGSALAAATSGVAYVSARPGTFADAITITITNLANGKSLTVRPVEGGFDPVALEAEPGDELEIRVRHADGSTSRYLTNVPRRKRPRVVRTVPPKDATDVVLSARAMVVFSEPVDGSTVTAENIQLELIGEPVEGTLRLSDDGLKAELTPTDSLQRATTYSLVITTGVLDLDSDPVEAQVRATFTTEDPVQVSQIQLCAKQVVVEEINGIQEPWPNDFAGWNGPRVSSTGPGCAVTARYYEPYGTFTYEPEGPELAWAFRGEGFVRAEDNWWHHYVLIYYSDPWPGRSLVCLGDGIPNANGSLRLTGRYDFGTDLNDAKIWIVRNDWVDCSGSDTNDPYWENPDGVPRLTNDRNDDGDADATETLLWCGACNYGQGDLAYDWLFETELINYHDTDG